MKAVENLTQRAMGRLGLGRCAAVYIWSSGAGLGADLVPRSISMRRREVVRGLCDLAVVITGSLPVGGRFPCERWHGGRTGKASTEHVIHLPPRSPSKTAGNNPCHASRLQSPEPWRNPQQISQGADRQHDPQEISFFLKIKIRMKKKLHSTRHPASLDNCIIKVYRT